MRWSWILLTLALLGCSETVSVLNIKLSLPPSYAKGFKCDADPRWSRYISVRASCDEGRAQSSFELQKGATLTLLNIPLGDCTVEVKTTNAHGRTVLAGEADVTLEEDKDETLAITLLPEPCRELHCDADHDGLYNSDEKGLKTNPGEQDSDKDGLSDGVEVHVCCTDPLQRNKPGDCPLRIQQMSPALGVVGTMVKITATDVLKSPTVNLGGVPMVSLLTDAIQIHGKVGKGAVLGDVVLASGGLKSEPYELMFATLVHNAETLVEMQVKANTTSGLMHEVVDMAHLGKLLLMLGKATASWSSKNPMLLIRDRIKKTYYRYTIPMSGTPIALAASSTRLVVLLGDAKGQGTLAVLELNSTGQLKVSKKIALKHLHPVDLEMEPKGDAAVVLFKGHLARIPLIAGPSGTDKTSGKAIPQATLSKAAIQSASPACTGLTLHTPPGGSGIPEAYLTCNMPSVLCPKNKKCPPRATLVRVAPLTKCLADNSANIPPSCWLFFQSGGLGLGAPEINLKNKTVHVLTNKGIYGTPLISKIAPNKTKVLIPQVLLGWPNTASATNLMAADARGHLFVVPPLQYRALMLRTDPGNQDFGQRKGRPFVVGGKEEEGVLMALHPDGSVLDVVQRGYDGSQGLTSICLQRCSGCVCSN